MYRNCLISHLSLPCLPAALIVLSVVLSTVLVVAVCVASFAETEVVVSLI